MSARNDKEDAERWRAVRPYLEVSHMFDTGRIGFAPHHVAILEFGGTTSNRLRIKSPDDRTRGPRFTVEQLVDTVLRDGPQGPWVECQWWQGVSAAFLAKYTEDPYLGDERYNALLAASDETTRRAHKARVVARDA